MAEKLFTTADLVRRWGKSLETVRRYVKEENLQHSKLGRTLAFTLEDVQEFERENKERFELPISHNQSKNEENESNYNV